MMFEEVMIQVGVPLNLCRTSKKSRGGLGGLPPHDVRRSDDSRGAIRSLKKNQKVAGGLEAPQ